MKRIEMKNGKNTVVALSSDVEHFEKIGYKAVIETSPATKPAGKAKPGSGTVKPTLED